MCIAIMKARGYSVSGHPGMLKEDKVFDWQRSPVTSACSRFHILSTAGAGAAAAVWLCPTKASVAHRVDSILLHAFASHTV